jgi:hypothetical protein
MPEEHLLYFNGKKLPSPKLSYVAWVDMMGTRNAMSQSLASSANHIGRIHAAIVRAQNDDLKIYPVLDGAYITSEKKSAMTDALSIIFRTCAEYFASQAKYEHRFLIRGGLAFGPVIHGSEITTQCNPELGDNERYRSNLLLGMPMVQSNRAESSAPPFGLFVDESARAFSASGSKSFSGLFYKWWKRDLPEGFLPRLTQHLQWAAANSFSIGYPKEKAKEHEEMAQQYFNGAQSGSTVTTDT